MGIPHDCECSECNALRDEVKELRAKVERLSKVVEAAKAWNKWWSKIRPVEHDSKQTDALALSVYEYVKSLSSGEAR